MAEESIVCESFKHRSPKNSTLVADIKKTHNFIHQHTRSEVVNLTEESPIDDTSENNIEETKVGGETQRITRKMRQQMKSHQG